MSRLGGYLHVALAGAVAMAVLFATLVASDFDSPDPASAVPVIGAGSCTGGVDPCSNLGENAVIGANSCIGDDACDNLTGTVGDGSCTGDTSCQGLSGTVEDGACVGTAVPPDIPGACQGLSGSAADGACFGAGSCIDAAGTIGLDACSGAESCLQIGATASLGTDACDGSGACSNITGTIAANACSGDGSCQNVSGTIDIGACPGQSSCSNVAGFIGSGSCAGISSCSSITSTALIGANACLGDGACAGVSGLIGPGSCTGDASCPDVGFTIGPGSCTGDASCQAVGGPIGDMACTGVGSCQDVDGSIGDQSCGGGSSCQAVDGDIGSNSCNGALSCQAVTGSIGDFACNAPSACQAVAGDVDDCEFNETLFAACFVAVDKSANPTSIPETGGTDVTYTVRLDFLEDDDLNSIEDDQFPDLATNPGTYCTVFDDNDISQGPLDIPGDNPIIIGWYVICEYTYEPPPGEAGTTHDNVVTVNYGQGIQETIQPAAISPGETPGTWDQTAEASVLYMPVDDPTPTPTATPTATAEQDNDDEPAQITIRKETVGGLSGEFVFATDFGESFTLSHGESIMFEVEPGEYEITEKPEASFTLHSVVCTGEGDDDAIANGVEIEVDGGDVIECTFRNARPNVSGAIQFQAPPLTATPVSVAAPITPPGTGDGGLR